MIRDFKLTDLDELNNLIDKIDTGYELNDAVEIQKVASKFIVYVQNNNINGLAYTAISTDEVGENVASIGLYVEPTSRNQGIGKELYNELEKDLVVKKPDYVSANMRADIFNPEKFCKKMGFHKWWGTPELIYDGGGFSETELKFTVFEDKYIEKFIKMNQACYYPIQVSNDIKPYVAPEELIIQYKLNDNQRVFLALNNEDDILASVTLGDGEIDNLLVSPKYQGRGYGKQALQFGVNQLLEQGYKEIHLIYIENNAVAENLYYSLGFKPLKETHVYRKFL